MLKKLFRILIVLLVLALAAYLFRATIFRAVGDWLIRESPAQPGEVMFVLAGRPLERAAEAARLYQEENAAPKIVCTGGLAHEQLAAAGLDYTEALVTKKALEDLGVPAAAVDTLNEGTSTWEECAALVEYCKTRKIGRAVVVSTKFHTRRIRFCLERLGGGPTHFVIRGAPARQYDEQTWWQSEHGLIFVNNEYVKLLYYHINH